MLLTKPKIYTRYFNSLVDLGNEFEKTSTKKSKLREEYDFISNVPIVLKPFYPKVHSFKEDADRASYIIQKIDAIDSSYLMILPDHESSNKIENLLNLIEGYLKLTPHKMISPAQYEACITRDIIKKNQERVGELRKLREWIDLNEISRHYGYKDLGDYLEQLNTAILKRFAQENFSTVYFSHGDLCFSNILIFEEKLYLIDPKGADCFDSNFRPIHYELSKLSQSLLGNYDLVNHELFDIQENKLIFHHENELSDKVTNRFESLVNSFQTDIGLIRLIEASLFLSLIPFHKDSVKKMKGFLINSINIFQGI